MSDLRPIAAAALRGYRLRLRGIHGPLHWARVMLNARELAASTPGADRCLVDRFALLHDCRRVEDGDDPEHGERAAAYAAELGAAALGLSDAQLGLLIEACARHELGEVTTDPTIGCCWDADRLELARLGRPPIDDLLSTQAARDPRMQAMAWKRGTSRTVNPLFARAIGLECIL